MSDVNQEPYMPNLGVRVENVKKSLLRNADGLDEHHLQLFCEDVGLVLLKLRAGIIRKNKNATRHGSGKGGSNGRSV